MEMLCQIAMKNVETHHDFTFSTDLIMLVLGLVWRDILIHHTSRNHWMWWEQTRLHISKKKGDLTKSRIRGWFQGRSLLWGNQEVESWLDYVRKRVQELKANNNQGLAKDSLQALKKISQECPTACLRADALIAVPSYLDFFSIGVQVILLNTFMFFLHLDITFSILKLLFFCSI